MTKAKKLTISVIIVILAVWAIPSLLSREIFWFAKWLNEADRQMKQDTVSVENCKSAQIPVTELDTTLDPERKIVIVRWWDGELQKNIELTLPYYPETDFEGCSESAKRVLKHIQQIPTP
jgi:hypothetical protein